MNNATGAREDVLDFYKKQPFNATQRPETAAEMIKKSNSVPMIFPYSDVLSKDKKLLEVGCGAGWFSNSVAYHYGCNVVAIDFNPVALKAAKSTAEYLNNDVQFEVADLFKYECEPKDVVISIGVLHHTSDCLGGLAHCTQLTKQGGGLIFIGLYHKYGRKPFLDHFAELKEKGFDEDALFEEYRKLDNRFKDEVHARSWFLDQVLHPYETQHTLKEVAEVFEENGVELVSTSINNYEEIKDLNALFEMEKKLYDKGVEVLNRSKYFPGFFYVLGKRK